MEIPSLCMGDRNEGGDPNLSPNCSVTVMSKHAKRARTWRNNSPFPYTRTVINPRGLEGGRGQACSWLVLYHVRRDRTPCHAKHWYVLAFCSCTSNNFKAAGSERARTWRNASSFPYIWLPSIQGDWRAVGARQDAPSRVTSRRLRLIRADCVADDTWITTRLLEGSSDVATYTAQQPIVYSYSVAEQSACATRFVLTWWCVCRLVVLLVWLCSLSLDCPIGFWLVLHDVTQHSSPHHSPCFCVASDNLHHSSNNSTP
jgi:hypothetical protein